MMLQLTGLSGSGKTTLAGKVKDLFNDQPITIEIIDGDEYRKTLCSDLGFSKEDRMENIRRLGKVAASFMNTHCIPIIAAINPFELPRKELKENYDAKIIWIKCDLSILAQRDTKGLYKRALLPDGHPEKLSNLTGVNDIYEQPATPDLIIDTGIETIEESSEKLCQFILSQSRNGNS